MRAPADLRDSERRLTKRMASWDSTRVRRVLSAVREPDPGGRPAPPAAQRAHDQRRTPPQFGVFRRLTSMTVAETISNAVVKPLSGRRRPPAEWFRGQDVDDRPDSSSLPSGHTAAAVGFTTAVVPDWPWAGAACAVPAVTIAAERVHSGAHYPSDVATGMVIGLAAAAMVRAVPRPPLRQLA
jgi:hypothetical protein